MIYTPGRSKLTKKTIMPGDTSSHFMPAPQAAYCSIHLQYCTLNCLLLQKQHAPRGQQSEPDEAEALGHRTAGAKRPSSQQYPAVRHTATALLIISCTPCTFFTGGLGPKHSPSPGSNTQGHHGPGKQHYQCCTPHALKAKADLLCPF
jgi:hypothetical protein